MNNRELSFLRYISRLSISYDGTKILGTMLGAFWIVEALFFAGDSPDQNRYFFLFLGIVLFLVGLSSLYFGYQKAKTAYENGIEITGKIVNIGHGLITCEYSYERQICRSSHNGSKSRKAKEFKVGQEVILIMDRNNPKQVFIQDLYQ